MGKHSDGDETERLFVSYYTARHVGDDDATTETMEITPTWSPPPQSKNRTAFAVFLIILAMLAGLVMRGLFLLMVIALV